MRNIKRQKVKGVKVRIPGDWCPDESILISYRDPATKHLLKLRKSCRKALSMGAAEILNHDEPSKRIIRRKGRCPTCGRYLMLAYDWDGEYEHGSHASIPPGMKLPRHKTRDQWRRGVK